ncbi:MAG: hypothetical protein ACREQY_02430 [Candidatus Binatia bacterium]
MTEIPDFAKWSIFPFEEDGLKLKARQPFNETDWPRSGEPGGRPCGTCASGDEEYVWVDDHWRVRSARPSGVPVQLFLETREHVDMDGLDDDRAAQFGQMIVRLDRAIQAVGGIGRVHVNRWGDGGSHFHMWFYARPIGAYQMLGFCLPMWAEIYEPTPDDQWRANLVVVARELAKQGGRAVVTS